MKIIFAGTSHGIPEKNAYCSSTFIQIGDRTYIIDAGAPLSYLLKQYDIPHNSVKGIFITHMHGDHFNDLPSFCDQMTWFYRECDPMILLPEERGIALLKNWTHELVASNQREIRLAAYQEGVIFDDGVLKVTARKTQHIAYSYAFLLEAEGKRLLFTGDMAFRYPEYASLLNGEAYDVVVAEAAHHVAGEAGPVYRETDTKQMFINHCHPSKAEVLNEQMKDFAFPCAIAHDGLIYEL